MPSQQELLKLIDHSIISMENKQADYLEALQNSLDVYGDERFEEYVKAAFTENTTSLSTKKIIAEDELLALKGSIERGNKLDKAAKKFQSISSAECGRVKSAYKSMTNNLKSELWSLHQDYKRKIENLAGTAVLTAEIALSSLGYEFGAKGFQIDKNWEQDFKELVEQLVKDEKVYLDSIRQQSKALVEEFQTLLKEKKYIDIEELNLKNIDQITMAKAAKAEYDKAKRSAAKNLVEKASEELKDTHLAFVRGLLEGDEKSDDAYSILYEAVAEGASFEEELQPNKEYIVYKQAIARIEQL